MCSLSCFCDISNPLLFLLPLSLTHQVPQNITMVLMTGADPTIAIPARCFCFFCHSHTGCLGPLLGLLMPAGFKNHLLFKTVQNTPLPFTARMPRRRNKQSGNRILTALRRLRIKIEPRSRVLLILPFKCKQIMKCKRIMKSDMSQYKERVELFSI